MPDEFDPFAREVLTELGLTPGLVHAHVIRPEALAHAVALHEAGSEAGDDRLGAPRDNPFYRLDVDGLGNDLHGLLSPCVAGYVLQLRRYGRVLLDRRWRWARTPTDGSTAWAPDVKMHVASVSKLITAIALTRVLREHAISVDARIAPWLPRYWRLGPGVAAIRFRDLLAHTSGLFGTGGPGPLDYLFTKDQVAIGVGSLPTGYKNANYTLCRILIAT